MFMRVLDITSLWETNANKSPLGTKLGTVDSSLFYTHNLLRAVFLDRACLRRMDCSGRFRGLSQGVANRLE